MATLCSFTRRKYPTLSSFNIWGFVDGVKFRVQRPKDEAEQNAYYTAFKKMHVINNVVALFKNTLSSVRMC